MSIQTVRGRLSTGVEGLDNILAGGLPKNRIYLVEGNSGTGKTTLALQFLLQGVREGDKVLYITLSETKEELDAVAESHGWNLDGCHIFDLAVPEGETVAETQYTLFHPSEIELAEITKVILDEIEKLQPARVVFDSLSEMRLLARDPLRYRRQILALKQFFIGRTSTVILLDDHTSETSDRQLESLAHGVITLQYDFPSYGAPRRLLQVLKLRGVKYRGGYHDFSIERGGIKIYPRLIASEHHRTFEREQLSSGNAELDGLTGPLDIGTSTLIMGPAGAGKSTLAAGYAATMAQQGKRVMYYTFDENLGTFYLRTEALGIKMKSLIDEGYLKVRQIDPAELSPGEFSYLVTQEVEEEGRKIIVIDSLNGYYQSMPEAQLLNAYLHELLAYLAQQGVTTFMIMAQYGLLGANVSAPVEISYLADTVILLRYFEAMGEIKKAISIVKKRTGPHERTIREFQVSSKGIQVGEPLREFRGVLTGQPEYYGGYGALLEGDHDNRKS